jgi:hypothetical protein
MKESLADGDKKVEKSTPKPAERCERTDKLAIALAEEWNAPADSAGDSTGG